MTETETNVPWWQTATGYQIWPRSFQDTDGDGIGDLAGIVARLDHLADLGVGFVWLSPVYASPQRDMGYDISDYRAIAPEYGTLDDMDRLIAEARARGIGIVMDLVVNHTSDRHAWFRAARASRGAPERDWYVWRDAGPDGGPPTDLRACFGGPAWTWSEEAGQYYLGYFSPFQPDLNWQSPALRQQIWEMMNWWFARGIAGFRMDVISLIGKDVDAGTFEEGPDLHRFLREMHRQTLRGRDVVTIGESWSVSRDTARLYCGADREELDMVFQFNHIKAGWDDTHGKWKPRPRDLAALKDELFGWQEALADDGWNALFLSNHDLPRQVSKYGDDGIWRLRSARCLATAIHLMKGTPFVYQGEEIGMPNTRVAALEQLRDLETLGHWDEERARGTSWDAFLAGANENGRDTSRTPVHWSDAPNAGFSTGTPWIGVNPDYPRINVARDRADPDGVFAHYQRLIAARSGRRLVSHGRFRGLARDHPRVVAYIRELDQERLSVVANLSGEVTEFDVPDALAIAGEPLSWSVRPRDRIDGRLVLEPWEAIAVAR
ncbi:glycoside hydrolase family 13 protein [Palleronia rufa]|uniref:glycoside hydrolase family 13 protein n=1 Tax=Palleronia rufa TaxID=1530186 RepID=UPI00055CC180|nr:alpha-glucosidase [Palleronia rufa]